MMPYYAPYGRGKRLVLPVGHQCVGVLPTHGSTTKYFVVSFDEDQVYYVDVKTLECKAAHQIDMSVQN